MPSFGKPVLLLFLYCLAGFAGTLSIVAPSRFGYPLFPLVRGQNEIILLLSSSNPVFSLQNQKISSSLDNSKGSFIPMFSRHTNIMDHMVSEEIQPLKLRIEVKPKIKLRVVYDPYIGSMWSSEKNPINKRKKSVIWLISVACLLGVESKNEGLAIYFTFKVTMENNDAPSIDRNRYCQTPIRTPLITNDRLAFSGDEFCFIVHISICTEIPTCKPQNKEHRTGPHCRTRHVPHHSNY